MSFNSLLRNPTNPHHIHQRRCHQHNNHTYRSKKTQCSQFNQTIWEEILPNGLNKFLICVGNLAIPSVL